MATEIKPVIDVLNEGVRITLRAVVSEDDHCELHCRISESTVGDVGIAGLPLVDSVNQQAMCIQTPRASGAAATIGCRLPRGQSLLIASPQPLRDDLEATEQSLAQFYLIATEWKRPKLR